MIKTLWTEKVSFEDVVANMIQIQSMRGGMVGYILRDDSLINVSLNVLWRTESHEI